MSNLRVYDGKTNIPVRVNTNGPLATAGQVGDAAIEVIIQGVQGLVVNSFKGVVKTVVLTFTETFTEVDLVLDDGRIYRSITKKMNRASRYSQAIRDAEEYSIHTPEIRDTLIQALKNECLVELQKSCRQIK